MNAAWCGTLIAGAALAVAAAERSAGQKPPTVVASSTASKTAPTVNGDKNGKGNKSNKAATPGFTPEREAAALMFVRTHHPELADLLERLKQRRPQEYQRAIRDLFRASERLAQSQETQPLRYELELEEWKLASRAQLLVARMTMERTPALEQELRRLLAEQLAVHRKIVELDRDRAASRVAALDAELKRLDSDREQVLEEKLQKALKSAGKKNATDKSSSK